MPFLIFGTLLGGSLWYVARRLYGNAGDDSIYGMVGNDVLYGGNGNDQLHGGSTGMDTLYVAEGLEDAMTAAGLTWHHAGARLSKRIATPGFI